MSSRNDDPETPPEKENNSGSSLDHMDDIELGSVPPPTELDLSRLDETKIAKREMEKNKPVRPDWLWEKREDGSYEYWVRENVEIRAYIEYLERSGKDARRKMDEVIFTLRGKTGTASKRAEYAIEQITKIMGMLDVDPVVKHELLCIWPNDDRVKCNGYRDGNCAMPIRREEICKDIPKDPIGEEGKEPEEPKDMRLECPKCGSGTTKDMDFNGGICLACGTRMIPPAEEPDDTIYIPSYGNPAILDQMEDEPETYERCKRCEPKCDAATPSPTEEPTKEPKEDE